MRGVAGGGPVLQVRGQVKRWNGHEHAFELHKTHRRAVDSIYEQCKREAPDEAARRHLDRLYKCNAGSAMRSA